MSACTIEATAGHAAANSYSTIDQSDTYHRAHLYADAWFNASALVRCQALQMATRLLDYWFEWEGVTSSSTQALLWPRQDVIQPSGYQQDSETIPTRIVQATCELARHLIGTDLTADNDVQRNALQSLTVGSISMTFRSWAASKPIPDAVTGIVGDLGRVRGTSGGAVTIRRA